jgi:hypothetical protein
MKNIVEEYVKTLSFDVHCEIIKSWEKFEREGVIGDEPIRQHAEILMNNVGTGDRVVFWMREIVFEIYKQAWYELNN